MSSYSVADAMNSLPRLITSAMAGEEVVITRHGKPAVELRAVVTAPRQRVGLAAIRAERDSMPMIDITSVELLRRMYEDND